ncbi:hypothetical protein ACWEP8_38585 [Streptomyces hydrogenans]|uniref:hypothetical protein n=1 Tax=Streptomyces hydrogenans TaxID=1873719 RepID=UPI0035DC530B
MNRPHKTSLILTAAAIAATMLSPAAATAEEGPEPAPEGVCSGGWRSNVYGYKATHIGRGPVYKSGPGGKIRVTSITAETAKTSFTGTAGVTAKFAVAEAKVEISRESATEVSWGTNYQFEHDITRGKYGSTQYGSWGHNATWEKYYELPSCAKSQRTSGAVKIVNTSMGFRYWETSS